MTCFMCGHDKFKVQLESTDADIEKDGNLLRYHLVNLENVIYVWCSRCHTLIWDFSNKWASGDIANIWQWNGHTLVLKDRVTEADLTKEIQKLGKDKLELILKALQKETQDA